MLYVKAFHVVFMVSWMAGVFYLPRLFVYHAMCEPADRAGRERFKIMERKLFFAIMTPAMVLTVIFGTWLVALYGMEFLRANRWLHAKLLLVALLLGYHGWCYVLLRRFRDDANRHSHVFFRVFNEVPIVLLIGIVILVIVKPF